MATTNTASASKPVGTAVSPQRSALGSDNAASLSTPKGTASLPPAPATPPTKPQRMMMELAKLLPHPDQDAFNPSCSAAEDAQLDADLSANGQRDPIHVMPPGNRAELPENTVLDGHRRSAGLGRLGRTSAVVLVRWDLLDADEATVEAAFLRFNSNRRQLDPLSVAKNMKRQKELEVGGRLRQCDLQQLDRTISDICGGMSLRNAQRYLHAADAPPEILAAFRRGDITLTYAAQVGGMNPDVQQELVQAIDGITEKKKVRQTVGKFIRKYGVRPRAPLFTGHSAKLMDIVEKFADRLDERNGRDLHGPTVAKHLPAMHRIQKHLARLMQDTKRPGCDSSDFSEIFDDETAGKPAIE